MAANDDVLEGLEELRQLEARFGPDPLLLEVRQLARVAVDDTDDDALQIAVGELELFMCMRGMW